MKTEIWTRKNFFFFSHAEWKTLQLVSLPPFQFALISWMKRPVFDVFDCSFVPDCFLLQFFSLSVLVSRGLLREAGEEVRVHGHQLPGNFVQGRVPT